MSVLYPNTRPSRTLTGRGIREGFEGAKLFPGTLAHMVLKMGKEHPELA